MSRRIGVVTFPGSLDDRDTRRAVRLAGGEPVELWHKDRSLAGVDAVILPGGFSYGDYLRAGAISRFSPMMETVIAQARSGMPVLGICNGFQILTEAHLLPGAMLGNDHLHFLCRDQRLRVENAGTAWTADYAHGDEISVPLKNMDGRYVADRRTLDELEAEGRVVVRYAGTPATPGTDSTPEADDNPSGTGNALGASGTPHAPLTSSATSPTSPTPRATYPPADPAGPNGSLRGIAGICNAEGNVVGLMPHPEHATDPLVGTGSTDGLRFFTSVLNAVLSSASESVMESATTS